MMVTLIIPRGPDTGALPLDSYAPDCVAHNAFGLPTLVIGLHVAGESAYVIGRPIAYTVNIRGVVVE